MWVRVPSAAPNLLPSASGLGCYLLKVETGVRISLGALNNPNQENLIGIILDEILIHIDKTNKRIYNLEQKLIQIEKEIKND